MLQYPSPKSFPKLANTEITLTVDVITAQLKNKEEEDGLELAHALTQISGAGSVCSSSGRSTIHAFFWCYFMILVACLFICKCTIT